VPNDRPASLALARSPSGSQQAWAVWAGAETTGGDVESVALELVRMTNLDAPAGPSVGAEVEVRPTGLGNLRPDIAFSHGRGVIAWVEMVAADTYELKTTTFDDLSLGAPSLTTPVVVATTSNAETTATLVKTPHGLRLVARTDRLRVYTPAPDFSSWAPGSDGVSAPSAARPSAVAPGSGDILAAFESGDATQVARFDASGDAAVSDLASLPGHGQPSLATDGERTWVFMVRSDGHLVSRERSPDGSWSDQDVIEVQGEGAAADLQWPNAVGDVDGRLRVLLDGRLCEGFKFRNWVLAYERAVEPGTSDGPRLSVAGARVREGDRGRRRAVFRIRLWPVSDEVVTVRFATRDRSAVAPRDYVARSGSVSLPAGTRRARVVVAIRGDRLDEDRERFALRLFGATNAAIADGGARATIVDDDTTFSSTSVSARVARRIRVRGSVRPELDGRPVLVVLQSRRSGRFVPIARKWLPLRAARWNKSTFATHFARPDEETCRVLARLPRSRVARGSRARTERFGC
jgi:hypothetical protein